MDGRVMTMPTRIAHALRRHWNRYTTPGAIAPSERELLAFAQSMSSAELITVPLLGRKSVEWIRSQPSVVPDSPDADAMERKREIRTTYDCTCGHRHHVAAGQARHLPVAVEVYFRLRVRPHERQSA